MLPGLRILFAIILLSISVLIFGLGAAAYLRSAHEHFANATIRPIEAPAVARLEQAPATIAMLRVEPESTPAAPIARRDEPAATDANLPPPPADSVIAAINTPATVESAQADAAKAPAEPAVAPVQRETPRPAVVEIPPSSEPAPPPPAPSVTIETRTPEPAAAPTTVAALSVETREAPAKAEREDSPPTPAAPAVVETPVDASAAAPPVAGSDTLKVDDKLIETPKKTAVLGDPAAPEVAVKPPDDLKVAAPRVDPAEIEAQRKRLLAQKQARARAAKARRLAAARARAAAQAKAAAAPSNPFGSPTAGSLTNTPTRSGG